MEPDLDLVSEPIEPMESVSFLSVAFSVFLKEPVLITRGVGRGLIFGSFAPVEVPVILKAA